MFKTTIGIMFLIFIIFAMIIGLSEGLLRVIKCKTTEILAMR